MRHVTFVCESVPASYRHITGEISLQCCGETHGAFLDKVPELMYCDAPTAAGDYAGGRERQFSGSDGVATGPPHFQPLAPSVRASCSVLLPAGMEPQGGAPGSAHVAETVMRRALSERLAEAAAAAPHLASHAAAARERLEVRKKLTLTAHSLVCCLPPLPPSFSLLSRTFIPQRMMRHVHTRAAIQRDASSDPYSPVRILQAFSDVFDEVLRRGGPFTSILLAVKREYDTARRRTAPPGPC